MLQTQKSSQDIFYGIVSLKAFWLIWNHGYDYSKSRAAVWTTDNEMEIGWC